MKPLVSILIPAYNAEDWIADTLQSASEQTWPRKEIIVIDDGSRDRTAEVARRFSSRGVAVVSKQNEGPSATRNHAMRLAQGDYIQWLDADDLLSPNKIETQLSTLEEGGCERILLSGPWAFFCYRISSARFVSSSLWQDLSPVEWLLRKMGENVHMPNSTWLMHRDLAEAAGPWDESLQYDEDGEYFCRVLRASQGTRFIPEGRMYYRISGSNRVSNIWNSDKKRQSLLHSMKLHIQYIRSLEESDRVREACLAYIQNLLGVFYPERPQLVAELHSVAAELGGCLERPGLNWKYAWMEPLIGRAAAKTARDMLIEKKISLIRRWDKAMFDLEARKATNGHRGKAILAVREK